MQTPIIAALVVGLAGAGSPPAPAQAPAEANFAYRFLDEPVQGAYDVICPFRLESAPKAGTELRIAFDVSDAGLGYVRLSQGKAAAFREAGGQAQQVGEAAPWELQAPPLPVGDGNPALQGLTLQRRPDRVRLIAYDRVVLNLPWEGPLGGQVGVGARGAGLVLGEPLLQEVARPWLADDFTREGREMAAWQTFGGVWENTMVKAPGAEAVRSANPFALQVAADGQALATAGLWFWDTYQTSVSVKPKGAEAVGLCAYLRDARNYVLLRWRAGPEDAPGARQLLLMRDGTEQVLAQGDGGFLPGEWYQLALRVTPGRVEAFIDRDPVLAADTPALGQGGVGLCAQGGEALFDDALVAPPGAWDATAATVNPVFVSDQVMAAQELYLPRGLWRVGNAGEYWHWGEFFDDATVVVPAQAQPNLGVVAYISQTLAPLPALAEVQGIVLRGDGASLAQGYAVSLAVVGDQVTARLARNGTEVANGAAPVAPAETEPLLVTARGDTVSVLQGDREVLAYRDPEPLQGRKVALVGASAAALDQVSVVSEHSQDYPFCSGPTDWFGGKGLWDVTTRWPCQPGWTFFGGTRDENPVLWTKHRYEGDIVLEFFANVQMDLPPPPGYSHPSDVNAELCGDGRSLDSGYSFVLAGWNNTKAAILRQGEVVAETPWAFVNPISSNPEFHRHWFRVRAERLGNQVRFWVDGKQLLEYTDPDPLPGGRVALWSFHNGLMVGRARLWYADERPGGVVRTPPVREAALPPVPRTSAAEVTNDFEADPGEWQTVSTAPGPYLELDGTTAAAGRQSLKVTNDVEGGPFAVYAVTTPFRLADWSQLSFDYRLPPDVKVNLYLYVNGRWHAVGLTATQEPWDGVPVLSQVPGVEADGEWHHAQVDLLGPLTQMYPLFKAFVVKYVALSAPDESYVRCGLGGNHRGAHFWVDNFRIGPPTP